MPKDTKTLGNNKARAWESLGFVHKKRLCQRFDTTSYLFSADRPRQTRLSYSIAQSFISYISRYSSQSGSTSV